MPKKDIDNVIKAAVRQVLVDYSWKMLIAVLFLGLFIYLYFTISSSQSIDPLFVSVTNENRQAVVQFLQKIRKLPVYNEVYARQKEVFGDSLAEEVDGKHAERMKMIEVLTQIEKTHPPSRDVYLGLAYLWSEVPDEDKARYYKNKAHELDPEAH